MGDLRKVFGSQGETRIKLCQALKGFPSTGRQLALRANIPNSTAAIQVTDMIDSGMIKEDDLGLLVLNEEHLLVRAIGSIDA